MHKGIWLVSGLFLLWAPAGHAAWALVGVSENLNKYYVEWDSLEVEGNIRRISTLVDRNQPFYDGPRSLVFLLNFDCKRGRRQIVRQTAYAGSMGSGQVVASELEAEIWKDMRSGTIGDTMLRAVCARR